MALQCNPEMVWPDREAVFARQPAEQLIGRDALGMLPDRFQSRLAHRQALLPRGRRKSAWGDRSEGHPPFASQRRRATPRATFFRDGARVDGRAAYIADPRDPERVRHGLAEMPR